MSADRADKHVVIVGGGFAGIGCAKRLADEDGVHVTLLDRNNYHQFQPLLYQVATSLLAPADISYSLRKLFHNSPNVDVKMADKVEIKDEMGRSAPLQAVDIPAGGTVNFAPNGRYLNLVGLKAPLKEGDSFLITLKFDKAGTSSTAVKILGTGASAYTAAATTRRGDTTAGVTQR